MLQPDSIFLTLAALKFSSKSILNNGSHFVIELSITTTGHDFGNCDFVKCSDHSKLKDSIASYRTRIHEAHLLHLYHSSDTLSSSEDLKH